MLRSTTSSPAEALAMAVSLNRRLPVRKIF